MPTTHERALELYYSLRPGAYNAYNNFVLLRTPHDLQADMDGILAPNIPKVMLSSGQLVPVVDSTGAAVAGSPGTAEVINPDSGKIHLTAP